MTTQTQPPTADACPHRPHRIGAVSFLNSKPLICGLDAHGDVDITLAVPAVLPGLLDNGHVDVALVPVVDLLQAGRSWGIVSDACIGCDGETLTVRVFSRVPPHHVRRLHVDAASHTSVVLAQLIWQETYGFELEVCPFDDAGAIDNCEAVLLIGDKVVASAPYGFTYQTDLGGAWKGLTGLPFVFAVWAAEKDARLGGLPGRLADARDAGVDQAEEIAALHAPGIGWPPALARDYLTRYLTFTLDQRHRDGMARFLEMSRERNIVPCHGELTFV